MGSCWSSRIKAESPLHHGNTISFASSCMILCFVVSLPTGEVPFLIVSPVTCLCRECLTQNNNQDIGQINIFANFGCLLLWKNHFFRTGVISFFFSIELPQMMCPFSWYQWRVTMLNLLRMLRKGRRGKIESSQLNCVTFAINGNVDGDVCKCSSFHFLCNQSSLSLCWEETDRFEHLIWHGLNKDWLVELAQNISIFFKLAGANSSSRRRDGNNLGDSSSRVSSVPQTPRTEGEILQSSNLKSFSFAELKTATRNFRPDSVLGEGGFGCVFKGWIDEQTFAAAKPGTGLVIAVKRLNTEGFQGHKEWLVCIC